MSYHAALQPECLRLLVSCRRKKDFKIFRKKRLQLSWKSIMTLSINAAEPKEVITKAPNCTSIISHYQLPHLTTE